MLIGQVINMARFWTVKKNARKAKNELNVSQKSFLPSFWWDRSSAWRRFGSKSQPYQHFLHRCKFSSLFTFVIKTPLYRYVKHQCISILCQHSIMILLGSTDVCSILCHVTHHHSVDHIAGVQLGKSDDDDEGLCLALSSSLPL